MVSLAQASFIFFTIRRQFRLKNHFQKTLFVRHFYYLNFEPYRKEFRHESSVTYSARGHIIYGVYPIINQKVFEGVASHEWISMNLKLFYNRIFELLGPNNWGFFIIGSTPYKLYQLENSIIKQFQIHGYPFM